MKIIYKYFIYNNEKIYHEIFLFVLFTIFISIKSLGNGFLKMKVLSSGEFFVIFENKINIYNPNFTNCLTIFSFNNSGINPTLSDLDNISISDYNQIENKIYILCLIKTYLFIYDYTNNNMTYAQLEELLNYNKDRNNEDHFYNFIPYKIKNNNNINFTISFIYDNKIFFLYYSFDLLLNIKYLYNKAFEETDLEPKYKEDGTDESPPELSCHILYLSSIYLECFYSHFWATKLKTIKFNINEQPDANNEKNITTFNFVQKRIKRIKSISHNNKTLICFVDKNWESNALCYGNNENENFEEINCLFIRYCYDLETYFFNETNQFVLVCQNCYSFELSILIMILFLLKIFHKSIALKKNLIFILIIILAIFHLFIINQLMIMI